MWSGRRKRIFDDGYHRMVFIDPFRDLAGRRDFSGETFSKDPSENAAILRDLELGALAFVVLEVPPQPLSDPPAPPLLSELAAEIEEPTWIEVEVVDRRGHPYGSISLNVALPDGARKDIETDQAGVWRVDDLEGSGTCHLRATEFPAQPDARRTVELSGEEPILRVGEAAVLLRTGRTHRIVLARPRAQYSI